MSSLNTTTLNNTLKAQQLSGKKALQETAQAAGNTGFENLFATALSQRTNPQAKLSMINEELQEALGGSLGGSNSRSAEGNKKQFNASENNTPNSDANPYGMSSNTLAQANMWAQRDWAQSNRAESSAGGSGLGSNLGTSQPVSARQTESTLKPSENSAKAASADTPSKPEAQAQAKPTDDKPATTQAQAGATEANAKQDANPPASASNKTANSNANNATANAEQASNTENASLETPTTGPNRVAANADTAAALNLDLAKSANTEQNSKPALEAGAQGPSAENLSTQNLGTESQTGAQTNSLTSTLGSELNPSTDANALADQAKASDGKLEAPVGAKTDGLKTDSAKTQADNLLNNPNSNTANRPDLAQTAAAMQAQQASNGKAGNNAGNNARSLKAGDEILATSGTSSNTSGSTASNQATGIGLAGMATGRTGSAAEATIKTPVNQPGFVKELGAQVQWAVGKNLSTVDIRLSAGQMGGDAGSMNMRIIQRGQDIQLVIRTQDEATTSMLNQTIAGLKETMAQNGLQLTQVQIQTGNNGNAAGNSSLANAQQQAQQQAGQSGNNAGNNAGGQSGRQGNNPGNTHSDGQAEAAEPQRRNRSNGNIDLVA